MTGKNVSEWHKLPEDEKPDPIFNKYLIYQIGIVFIILLVCAIVFVACLVRLRISKILSKAKQSALPGNYECILTSFTNRSGNEDETVVEAVLANGRYSRGISEISDFNKFSPLCVYNTFNSFKNIPCPTIQKDYNPTKANVDVKRNVSSTASVMTETGSAQFHLYAEPDLVLGKGLRDRIKLLESKSGLFRNKLPYTTESQNTVCERELKILLPEFRLKGHEIYEPLRFKPMDGQCESSEDGHYEHLTLIKTSSAFIEENENCYITPIV